MAKYEKWLGASIGLLLTGNPIGGLLGFLAGSLATSDSTGKKNAPPSVSDFEVNLMVIAAHLIKIDGKISLEEIEFTQKFLSTHFDSEYETQRKQILTHCLQKDYDLNVACGQIRMYSTMNTRIQIVHFMFDLAMCDGELTKRENFFIFKIAGYLTVNDVEFRKIKNEHTRANVLTMDAYALLGAQKQMTIAEIRFIYRKLVLKYHPDKHTSASDEERKQLALKFQQIKEAYQQIKREKEA
jgi:DnaJ like chaperone protein